MLKIGVVGATGMVGQAFMSILGQRKFPVAELRPFASEASLGKSILLGGKSYPVQIPGPGCFKGLDLVFFSSGDEISAEWAPRAVADGAYAVDNSAAFRMHPEIALIVPEVNGHLLRKGKPAIIANPNCSTIQLVVALKPLSDKFGLEDVRVSSYQAASGAGQAGADELLAQAADYKNPAPVAKAFAHPLLFNVIPQVGSFDADGFCSEEIKIMKETRKILGLPSLKISAFTVRVPVLNSHSETAWVTLSKDVTYQEVRSALEQGEGLVVEDDPSKSVYPLARTVTDQDPVYVGRIHRDPAEPKVWMLWIVSDNIRKGAALNGIQIAERLFDLT